MSFKQIDNVKDYVLSLNKKAYYYAKFANIQAVQGKVGEKFATVMKNGLVETTNVVGTDEKTGKPDWIVTNPSGEKYLVKDSVMQKKYEVLDVDNNMFKPKGAPSLFVQIDEDVSFTAPWGEVMNIVAGGYLNVTNLDDIYGIQPQEFAETYAKCDKFGVFDDDKLNYKQNQEQQSF